MDSYYDRPLPGGNDPLNVASSSYRVIRGGNWSVNAQSLRSANRNYDYLGGMYLYVGLRLVRTR